MTDLNSAANKEKKFKLRDVKPDIFLMIRVAKTISKQLTMNNNSKPNIEF